MTEPQHKMYLNIYPNRENLTDEIIEPQHKMYLNSILVSFIIELQ